MNSRVVIAAVVAVGLVLAAAPRARADGSGSAAGDAAPNAVALLPLDTVPSLEIYGQPVAGAVARVLTGAGIDVVVVGPRVAVPDRARLIVDGTIKPGKGAKIELTMRVRERATGAAVGGAAATAESIDELDRAAGELSTKMLPEVKAALAKPRPEPLAETKQKPAPTSPASGTPGAPGAVAAATAPAPKLPIAIVGVADTSVAAWSPLHDALFHGLDEWTRRGRYDPKLVGVGKFEPALVANGKADLGIALDVVAFDIETLELDTGKVTAAHARVRVRVANRNKIVFDRVIVTDTVIGKPDQLAALCARDVLWIAEPHLRKVSAWQ